MMQLGGVHLMGSFYLLCFPVILALTSGNQLPLVPITEQKQQALSFSPEWQSLGPFRTGTREAIWGADPLEASGGFRHLKYNTTNHFRSPLLSNATVRWKTDQFQAHSVCGSARINICLEYDNVDWPFLRSIYGWAALQFQSWARGELINHGPATRKATVHTTNVLEFWLNDQHYFGADFYGFARAPVVVDLIPGPNIFNVRLIRDVRATGGVDLPNVEAQIRVSFIKSDLEIVRSSLIIPDVISGRFVSSYGSIIVYSTTDAAVSILGLYEEAQPSLNLINGLVSLSAGQSRPVNFQVDRLLAMSHSHTLTFRYQIHGTELIQTISLNIDVVHRSLQVPHKFTFLHPSGAVSYAILRPPPKLAEHHETGKLPILVGLHGAGLEADSSQVRHAFDAASDLRAWMLFPTGMSPWSGDDWHTWGFADIQSAISAIPLWILYNQWSGPDVYLEKYIITGHSNGGQGTWFTALHQPDRILAVAPASAYSSIENYVPFVLWNEGDPLQNAIINSARSSFRHELFLENLQDIPVLAQHGETDKNVPAYHSRLMTSLASYAGVALMYFELPQTGHWFEGAMTTSPLLKFYHRHVESATRPATIPNQFSFVVGNSDDFGSRYGLEIVQLLTPDRLADIRVEVSTSFNATWWSISSANVHRLRLRPSEMGNDKPDAVQLDHNNAPIQIDQNVLDISLVRNRHGIWKIESDDRWQDMKHRTGRQRGAMDAILRTAGPFQILYCCPVSYKTALQVSRNLLQYFGADSMVRPLKEYDDALNANGNLIVVALKYNVPNSRLAEFPIHLEDETLQIRTANGFTEKIPTSAKMGGSWLRPLPGQRLELVLWGWDMNGLQQAARMAPTLTGGGQPDFVVFGAEAGRKGHAGTLAMGFFDYVWNISKASFLP